MTMKKKIKKLTCTANEYFWLKNELAKAQKNLHLSVFSGDGSDPQQRERTQAFAILIEFYQNALEVFAPHADTKVTNPVSISRQFIADLKSLDDTGFININMTRKPAAG